MSKHSQPRLPRALVRAAAAGLAATGLALAAGPVSSAGPVPAAAPQACRAGTLYLTFDTGHGLDPSPTSFDYASHGVIAWIPSTEEIGVTSLTLDENLVEIDRLQDVAPEIGHEYIGGFNQLHENIPTFRRPHIQGNPLFRRLEIRLTGTLGPSRDKGHLVQYLVGFHLDNLGAHRPQYPAGQRQGHVRA